MSKPIPVQTPGGFAPVFVSGMDDGTGNLALINESRPLPVSAISPISAAPLTGQTSGDLVSAAFEPAPGKPVFCTLAGDWQGTVQLKRSTDGGATLHQTTVAGSEWGTFSSNACEAVWEESEDGAQLYLDCRITSGTLSYRLAQ